MPLKKLWEDNYSKQQRENIYNKIYLIKDKNNK